MSHQRTAVADVDIKLGFPTLSDLDKAILIEQSMNIAFVESTPMIAFVKDVASLVAVALFVTSFSLIIHAI